MSSAEKPGELEREELARYSRHLLLPEVGLAGQERLKAARVLLIGMGGLGSPTALYLAAAGVGTLGLVDDDAVEVSNLQRQILYATADAGQGKVSCAARRLAALNPHTQLIQHPGRVDAGNATTLIRDYDVIVDGSDNFPTRYAVSDAAAAAGKPYVYGAILRFDGQVAVFHPPKGPCYRCLFPVPPPAASVPSCGEAGVLGVLPGVIGSLQASECLKVILGIGEPLRGRLLTFSALTTEFATFKVARDPSCPACGSGVRAPAQPPLARQACARVPNSVDESAAAIEPQTLAAWLTSADPPLLVDVRRTDEIARNGAVAGARHIALGDLNPTVSPDAATRRLVVYCQSGARSLAATRQLRAAGLTQVWSLQGGFIGWLAAGGVHERLAAESDAGLGSP